VSIQVGAILGITVGHGNTVQLNDEGAGGYQAEWNGGPVHSFTGVQAVYMYADKAKHDQITINLNDLSPASSEAGLTPSRQADTVGAEAGANSVASGRTSGTAVQSGTLLTVKVSKPTTNQVQILDQGGGAVEVDSNGGGAQSFTGVTTILVQAKNTGNDQITFYTPPLM